jgi:hypothetical protein
MIQLSRKLLAIILLCLAIAGCSYEDKSKIRELQNQLTECKNDAQVNQNKLFSAWEAKKQNLDACLTANNNLYNFVDDRGTFLDKTAKLFNIYPWQTFVIGLVLLVISSVCSFIGIGVLFEWRNSAKHKEAEKIIKTAKEARQTILEASNKLTHRQDQINALESQKTTLLDELEQLKQYQNVDELHEKAKVIAEAKQKANRIFEANISKIKAQATKIQAELDQERAKLDERCETLNQKETELEQKTKELEEIRQAMIEG